jgi:hypothetical protein
VLWREAAATSGRRRDVAALHTKRSGRRRERLDTGEPRGSNVRCGSTREEERCCRSSTRALREEEREPLISLGFQSPEFCATTPGRRRGAVALVQVLSGRRRESP